MKKVIIVSVLFLASCSQITDVANGVGGAAGNVISSVADAVVFSLHLIAKTKIHKNRDSFLDKLTEKVKDFLDNAE